jgi:hypothetical protein
MQVAVPPQAVLRAIESLKAMVEERDTGSLDPENLYRHVRALLAGEDAPELAPSTILAGAESFAGIEMGVGDDPQEAEAMSRPIGTPEGFRAAAEWAFVLYRDFFSEEPSDGNEEGFIALTAAAHGLLRMRAAMIAMYSSSLS